MSTPFLDQLVEAWATQKLPGVRCTVKRVPHNTALIIEIEASRVLATIEAWEAAECLDITTLDLVTKQGTIHSAGPTKTAEEMHSRLAALRDVLLAYEVSNAA